MTDVYVYQVLCSYTKEPRRYCAPKSKITPKRRFGAVLGDFDDALPGSWDGTCDVERAGSMRLYPKWSSVLFSKLR